MVYKNRYVMSICFMAKHKMLKRFEQYSITLLFILLATNTALLQNLSSLYQEMETSNFEIQSYEKQKDAVLEGAEQFVWLPDPEFGLGAFPSPVETRLGSQLFRLSAMQMIPHKGISLQKKETAKLNAAPILDQRDARLLQNRYKIKQEWLNIYRIQETQNIIQQNIELLESLEKIALKKVESGKGKMSDVLIVQLKRNEIEEQINILASQLSTPNANINQLLNRNPNQKIVINEKLEFPEMSYDKNDILIKIQENHPALSKLIHQKEIARSEIQQSEYAQKPVFGVGLDYIYVNARNDAEPSWNGRDILQLKATVKIPINKKPYEARDKSNLVKIEALDLQEMNAKSELERIIENAFAEYRTAELNKDLAVKQMTTVQSVIKLLENEYSDESAVFDQLITMEMEIIKYEKRILVSIIKAYEAINVLENLAL